MSLQIFSVMGFMHGLILGRLQEMNVMALSLQKQIRVVDMIFLLCEKCSQRPKIIIAIKKLK